MAAPPPTRWQADELDSYLKPQSKQARQGLQAGFGGGISQLATDVDTASNAWKHVKTVIVDDGKSEDLFDLLLQSGKQAIDPTPAGWPSLLKPRAPMMGKMPALVMQRYNAHQTVCFCGVFPEIHRAWASVDNSLFLWRYDKWNDVPEEYRNEEQAICAVGLVKPKPDVFTDSVQHVLVVCTTTEIVLLGVCCSSGGSADRFQELSLLQLPGYSMSADNVPMCAVAATADGRIFLGGTDGHLYELLYHSTDSWRHKRFSKRDHSRGLSSYLPSFIPALWSKPSPLLEVVVDDERHILYTRSQHSSIQVFDLGADGKDASVRQVAEMHDFMYSASQAAGGESFRGRSPADRRGAGIIHLAVVSSAESEKLHLVAVTLDGRRVYLTTAASPGYAPLGSSAAKRPHGLKALIARPAPSQPLASTRGGTASSKALELGVALYHQGALLLSEAPQEGRSRLLICARDMTLPPLGLALSSGRADGLREAVGQLEMLVPGETCYMRAVQTESPWAAAGNVPAAHELAAQTVLPAPRFVLISTAGVLEVEKRRPVDVLHQMLEERSGSKLEQFFKSYGPAEVAAMCFLLINSPPADASANAVGQAKAALENRSLTGVPQMRAETGVENVPPQAGFDMGQALPVAEPEWSGAHQGLCLYVARLLQPVWEQRIVAAGRESPELLDCKLPAAALQAAEARLRSLAATLVEYRQRRLATGSSSRLLGSAAEAGVQAAKRPRLEEAERLEGQRVDSISGLVMRAAEACFLLRTLGEHHMPRLASRLDEPMRARLLPLTLRDWVCSREGDAVAAQLISVLVTEHLTATGGIAEELAVELQSGCPSYFKESDKVFYQASGLMQRAEAAGSPLERDSLTNQALTLMMKVPLACDMGQVIPQLAFLRNFAGCVELPLRKAAALDPGNLAASDLPERRAARELRHEMCYVYVMQVLKFLIQPGAADGAAAMVERQSKLSDSERESAKELLLQRAAAADDSYFREVLYNTLVDVRALKELLALDSPALEAHLKANGGLPSQAVTVAIGPLDQAQVYHLELLARLYRKRGAAGDAAAVYEILASRRSGVADQAISLPQREEAYQEAVLQARAQGDPSNIDRLEVKLRITQLQQLVVEALQAKAAALPEGSAEEAELREAAAELREVPQELAILYNDYAVPHRLWELGLEMVALANFDDPAYIRQLWDVYLRQAWEERQGQPAEAFEACCQCVERLGSQLSAGSRVFPEAHVCMRLELMAAGIWPAPGSVADDPSRAAEALLKACGRREEGVLAAYDALLRMPGGDGDAASLHTPPVRARLLNAVLGVLRGLAQRAQDQRVALSNAFRRGPIAREVGRLIDACETYAAEAGRLQPPATATALAAEFAEVRSSLEELLQWTS